MPLRVAPPAGFQNVDCAQTWNVSQRDTLKPVCNNRSLQDIALHRRTVFTFQPLSFEIPSKASDFSVILGSADLASILC